MAPQKAKPPARCPQCEALRQELAQAREQLAAERERVNALRLGMPKGTDDAEVRQYPQGPSLGPPPFRYVLVDAANEQLKRRLGPVQKVTKELVQWAAQWTSGRRGR